MKEKVTKFYEAVSADSELEAELTTVVDGVNLDGVAEEEARRDMAEAVAAFAAEHDFDLTAEDILAADAEGPEGELSETELETVAGGGGCGCFIIGAAKGCGCFIAGGNKWSTDNPDACAFVGN